MLLTAFAGSALAQTPQPGSTRSFKAICSVFQAKGQDLVAQCPGTIEFSIPSEAELKSGKRPMIRIPYAGKHQLWELGEPKSIPNSSAVVINAATVDGEPAQGRCAAQTRDSFTVSFDCNSLVAARGAAGSDAFEVIYSNAPNGGTASGSPLELLDYVAGVSVLLGGKPPQRAAATQSAAPPSAKPAPAVAPRSDNASSAQNKPAPAAAADPFKPSTDPKAIFGLMVGKPRPMTLPVCKYKDAFSKPAFAANQLYCVNEIGTGLNALLGGLKEDLTLNDYQQLGIAPIAIDINEQIYDTRITESVTIFFDRNDVIQRVRIVTFLVSHDDVLKMLIAKYGKPAKEDWTIWSNRQTGAEVDRTPNYFWDFPGISVDYISRAADLLNAKTPTGSIDVYTAAYSRSVSDYLKRRDAPPEGRKPM